MKGSGCDCFKALVRHSTVGLWKIRGTLSYRMETTGSFSVERSKLFWSLSSIQPDYGMRGTLPPRPSTPPWGDA